MKINSYIVRYDLLLLFNTMMCEISNADNSNVILACNHIPETIGVSVIYSQPE